MRKVLIVAGVIVTLALGYFVYFKYFSLDKEDPRRCISGSIPFILSERWLVGKSFTDSSASGVWGEFKKGGVIDLGWGLDYDGPNDNRVNREEGTYEVKNGKILINGSNDIEYSGLRFYYYKWAVFGIPSEDSTVIIGNPPLLGGDKTSTLEFYDNVYSKVKCN